MQANTARRSSPGAGTRVIWPAGLEERLGISSVTRWRWERAGRLPPRDIRIGPRSGWCPETIEKMLAPASVTS